MVKTYEDYLDEMKEKFPEIDPEYMKDMIKFGLQRLEQYLAMPYSYAVTYKHPKSSFLIDKYNETGMTARKKKFGKIKDNVMGAQRATAERKRLEKKNKK